MLLTLDDFVPLIGEQFGFEHDALCEQAVALIEASPINGPERGGRRPFSLLFEGPAEPMLEQRTYRVSNPAFASLELFIVPVGPSPSGIRYEAIFN